MWAGVEFSCPLAVSISIYLLYKLQCIK
uniref:Uncharacterized protein n=1 Tax=Rhizophora mucronata TaxID=61149 RepID=A0A2P2NV79_RHIMU